MKKKELKRQLGQVTNENLKYRSLLWESRVALRKLTAPFNTATMLSTAESEARALLNRIDRVFTPVGLDYLVKTVGTYQNVSRETSQDE